MRIACGQITWRRDEFTPEQVLAQIARAGYEGAPAGGPAAEARARFAAAGLAPAPGYLGAALWDPDEADGIVARAHDRATTMAALGVSELYVAANLTPERRAIAGRVSEADGLPVEGYRVVAATLDRVGAATLEHGVRTCFHNHVGSFIETRAEIDRLFGLVDRSLVFQGPDAGHLTWAGDDVVDFCRAYAADIHTIHIKDIDPRVLAAGVAAGWDYAEFSRQGIFTELGQGLVDFPALFDVLNDAGFGGWVVVETDVTQRDTALQSATISRDYLRSIGV